MKASDSEFQNRATIFGIVFGGSFLLYTVDPQNATAVLANWLESQTGSRADFMARGLFLCATMLCAAAALLRTWASSYLDSSVVYAARIQSVVLVADGPYRFVRNPLYFANVLLAIARGSMMSRSGYAAAVLLTLGFCLRLILREEADSQSVQGEPYSRYRDAVPRVWPSLLPRVATSGREAKWSAGLTAELWMWAFMLALLGFALTLSTPVFFTIMAAGLVLFWLCSRG